MGSTTCKVKYLNSTSLAKSYDFIFFETVPLQLNLVTFWETGVVESFREEIMETTKNYFSLPLPVRMLLGVQWGILDKS